jgi:hypothetical protein
LAGFDVANDGTQTRMMLVALQALHEHPGLTANELEAVTGLVDGKLRKRLNDLRKKGLAHKGVSRMSQVSGKLNATWFAGGGEQMSSVPVAVSHGPLTQSEMNFT